MVRHRPWPVVSARPIISWIGIVSIKTTDSLQVDQKRRTNEAWVNPRA
jgi:hypothetical protein